MTRLSVIAFFALVSLPACADPAITQPATGHYYQADGANIDRLNDRVLIGGATLNSGNALTPPATDGDWLSQIVGLHWPTQMSRITAETAPGITTGGSAAMAITGAARASDGTGGAIGVSGFGFSDCSGCSSFAFYGEAHGFTNSLGTMGMELDVAQHGPAMVATPYNVAAYGGQAIDLWLVSGGAAAYTGFNDATAAIAIGSNGGKFKSGIIFRNDALAGTYPEAIALPKGANVNWYTPTGGQGASISSSVIGATATQLIFSDYGPIFLQGSTTVLQANVPSTGNVGMLLATNRSGTVTLQQVRVGAANSCGVGKRCLTVDN